MKIVIIDPSGFTPPYDHCLANVLSRWAGCDVAFVSTILPPGPWSQSPAYERWEHFYRINSKLSKTRIGTYLKGCEHLFDMERLVHRLRHWKPDIIHFQWLPFPITDNLFLPRLRKIAPLVLTMHDTQPFHGSPSSRFQLVGLKAAYLKFDHYIVHTQYSKESLVKQLELPETCVTVISHGVFDYYHELVRDVEMNKQLPEIAGKKKVLFFGVLKPYKGVDVLLKAFAQIPAPLAKEVVLEVVGYPNMPVEPLHSLSKQLGIANRVIWDLRFVDEKEVAIYFSQADVVVLPYRRIDQSGVLMVALAFGKPVVASCVGGFAEIIKDGVHGFLVEPGNAEALSFALTRILEDDLTRAQMAKAVEKIANEELSWERIAERTLCLYQEVEKRRS